ncbi:hypothetical protein CRYUN_Cryun14cG0085100 [Craigia yunnanensis]
MSERQELQLDPQILSPQGSREDMILWVVALETVLLPCLPARELQAIDRSPFSSESVTISLLHFQSVFIFFLLFCAVKIICNVDFDVERHVKDFMEAAKKLQLYFIGLQREDQPSKAEMLRKEIVTMEEELKVKSEMIKNQGKTNPRMEEGFDRPTGQTQY